MSINTVTTMDAAQEVDPSKNNNQPKTEQKLTPLHISTKSDAPRSLTMAMMDLMVVLPVSHLNRPPPMAKASVINVTLINTIWSAMCGSKMRRFWCMTGSCVSMNDGAVWRKSRMARELANLGGGKI